MKIKLLLIGLLMAGCAILMASSSTNDVVESKKTIMLKNGNCEYGFITTGWNNLYYCQCVEGVHCSIAFP